MTIKELLASVRSLAHEDDINGLLSDNNLLPAFQLAWRHAFLFLENNDLSVTAGSVPFLAPAYSSTIRLSLYTGISSIQTVMYKKVTAKARITQVAMSADGVIVSVAAMTDLIANNVGSGSTLTLLGLPGNLGLNGDFAVVYNNEDNSFLIPGFTLDAVTIFDASSYAAYAVMASGSYVQITGTIDIRGITSLTNPVETQFQPIIIGDTTYSETRAWMLENGNLKYQPANYDRMFSITGTLSTQAPSNLDENVPDSLNVCLVLATYAYHLLGIDPSQAEEYMTRAFGNSYKQGFPSGAIKTAMDNLTKSEQSRGGVNRDILAGNNPMLIR